MWSKVGKSRDGRKERGSNVGFDRASNTRIIETRLPSRSRRATWPDSRGIRAVQTPAPPRGNPNCLIEEREREERQLVHALRSSVFCGLLISGRGWNRVEDSWGQWSWVLFRTVAMGCGRARYRRIKVQVLRLVRIRFLKGNWKVSFSWLLGNN